MSKNRKHKKGQKGGARKNCDHKRNCAECQRLKKFAQPHKHTVMELLMHLFTGLLVTFICMVVFFPDVHIFTSVNAAIAVSTVKFVVNYGIRRFFTHLDRRHHAQRCH